MNILMLLTPKKDVEFLLSSNSVDEGLELLRRVRYSSVPLLNREGYFVGTITEGDLLWHIEKSGFTSSKKESLSSVKRIRDYSPVRISATMDELISTSLGQNFIPILDDRDFFIGIVTRKDLLNNFISNFQKKTDTKSNNPLLDALYKRRSIRKFKADIISNEVLDEILKVALVSPTARNAKPQHVILVDDEAKIKELSRLHQRGGQFESAPYLLLVLSDETIEENSHNALSNSGALMMSLLLAIDSFENLGGFWIGTRSSEHSKAMLHFLNVPARFRLNGMIAFGFKNEVKAPNEATNIEKIHKNGW